MRRGFSLVEMLIYIAIVSATFVLVINVSLTLSRSYSSLKNSKSVQNAVSFGLERIVHEIRNAVSVDTSASLLNVPQGKLRLITSSTGSTVDFYLSSSTIYMNRDGVFQGPLTTSDVSVTRLIFTRLSTTTSQAVKIEMGIQSTSTTVKNESFYDTVVLRGGYQ